MHRFTTFVAVLLVCASGVLSKPSSEDQYGQTRLASKADEQRPALHKVRLTATDLHRLELISFQKNKNSEPQVNNYDKITANVNNIDHIRRKRDLKAILSGRDIEEDKIYEENDSNNNVRNIQRRKRNLEAFLNQNDNEERRKRDAGLFQNQEETKRNLEAEDMINEGDTDEIKERKKRDYIHWFGIGGGTTLYNPPIQSYQFHGVPNLAPWNSFSHSIPSTQSYQTAFPFFGGQLPIFFPPKPILFNPGYPIYNRPERPRFPVLPRENDTSMPVDIPPRFGDPNDDRVIEQHPVWGVVGESEEVPSGGITTTTRRPFAERPTGSGNQNIYPTRRPFQRTTTQRPTTTTAGPKQLGRCTWAIITCCSPKDDKVKYNCFENAGCEGAFWGSSPCSREATLEALEAAQEFYESQQD